MSHITSQALIDFVYHEADLLDTKALDAWLALFAEDGVYWMPLQPDQQDARLVGSLMYEDRVLLATRVERLKGKRTFSQQPESRCHHLLQQPRVLQVHDQGGRTRTAFHYTETRADEQAIYAGWATHDLQIESGELRIRCKRVDLVNCDAAFGNIQLFM